MPTARWYKDAYRHNDEIFNGDGIKPLNQKRIKVRMKDERTAL